MAAQLLIYETAVPVSLGRHGASFVETITNYEFTRSINSVPLVAVEFPNAAAEYAIVFSGTGDVVMPAVILGVRRDENLYLGKNGKWEATYIPAFVRRYPFVFSSSDEGKNFTLCIAGEYPGLNQEGRGDPLFKDGKPTPYVDGVLKFLEQYQIEFQRTQTLCKKLKDLNLLEPMQAEISIESGEKIRLTGFSTVSRSRLKTLSSEALVDLVTSDMLELIYLHLSSMRNFSAMRDRFGTSQSAGVSTGAAADEKGANVRGDDGEAGEKQVGLNPGITQT